MFITKQFESQVFALSKKGSEQAEALRELGYVAVRKAYNQNHAFCQFMLDTLTQGQRKPLYTWFKRAGINVEAPASGSARYTVCGVVDSKRQDKAFKFCENTPVIDTAHVVAKEVVVKALQGTAIQRAVEAVTAKIKAMREKDPEGAGALNELVQAPAMGLYIEGNKRIALTEDEVSHLVSTLTMLRLEAKTSAQAVITNAQNVARGSINAINA